jgi:O-antigen ligase
MAQATTLPLRLWQLAVLGLAALVGLAAGVDPRIGIGLALAVAYVAIVLSDLALGLILFVGLIFLESIEGFGALSLAKGAGALLALSWIALVGTDRAGQRQIARDHPFLIALLGMLAAWTLVSALWADEPVIALEASTRWILNLAMFPIVYVAVREPRHVRALFAVFVAGALLSAVVGLVTGSAADAGRLDGSGVNANNLGELLVVAVVLAAGLGASRLVSIPGRGLAFVASALSVAALLATVSRGAIVGLLFALAMAPLLVGPGRRLLAMGLVVLAAGFAIGYVAVVAPRDQVERLTTADASGSGRTDIWTVGLRMVRANPAQGVGAGNYANSTIHYLLEPGTLLRSDYIVDDPKAAHNVYLQTLAELGVVGLVLFLSVIAFALRSLVGAARDFRAAGARGMEVLSRALLIGLCGLLAALFFSTAIYSKQLWLLLALSVALGAMARGYERPRPADRAIPAPTTRAHAEPGSSR